MNSTHYLLPLLLGLAACGGGGGSDGGGGTTTPGASQPSIQSFGATPANITAGQSSTLSWQSSHATSLSISPGVGLVSGNSVAVAPVTTTTYTLTASNAAGTITASTTVTVGSGNSNGSYGSMAAASLGIGAALNGSLPFPASNAWNQDISAAPVDPNSTNILTTIGLTRGLHPDFGAGLYEGAPIGIPYVVVAGTQAKVNIRFTAYGDESDPGPYPVPGNAPIEGKRPDGGAFDGDRHVLVVDKDNNRLYELYRAFPQSDGSWNADAGAVFHLDSNTVRPGGKPGWTSADAAGLPIFPGLVRYDEAASGTIRHALRFTVNQSRRAYVPPATHWAASSTDPNRAPMGMRVRLKASYAIPASFSTESRAILQAMKTYGMIVADNGSNWYVSGAPDDRWNNDKLVRELGSVKGADFEVIRMDGLVTP
ncbi:hypothetical protein GCM10007907_01860 [Chitinimonas prasina]|uniref:Uncharacterized protein n=1 Tax=Chitinimonas prasina TaxID=1434937 RepID=A0ABQ5YA03_9NEIS|nr:hypothetical protein [Chitinimonas prasina]GLR11396.1 hypothetical protein GCM10007907_01860 [Chitinimonas prasina]